MPDEVRNIAAGLADDEGDRSRAATDNGRRRVGRNHYARRFRRRKLE
jgi:hypothetical protein